MQLSVESVESEEDVMGTVDVTKDSRSAELIFWRECESSDRNRMGMLEEAIQKMEGRKKKAREARSEKREERLRDLSGRINLSSGSCPNRPSNDDDDLMGMDD